MLCTLRQYSDVEGALPLDAVLVRSSVHNLCSPHTETRAWSVRHLKPGDICAVVSLR